MAQKSRKRLKLLNVAEFYGGSVGLHRFKKRHNINLRKIHVLVWTWKEMERKLSKENIKYKITVRTCLHEHNWDWVITSVAITILDCEFNSDDLSLNGLVSKLRGMKTTSMPLSQKINVQIVETAQLENVSSEDISPTFDDAVKAIKNVKWVFSLN